MGTIGTQVFVSKCACPQDNVPSLGMSCQDFRDELILGLPVILHDCTVPLALHRIVCGYELWRCQRRFHEMIETVKFATDRSELNAKRGIA